MRNSIARAQIERSLNGWQLWNTLLSGRPDITKPLNTGLSHSAFLVEGYSALGNKLQYVMRIENPVSRQLAIPLDEEVRLMVLADTIAPEVIYADQQTLVTEWISGSRWPDTKNIDAIGKTLSQLHRKHTANIRSIDLKNHCQSYWSRLGRPADLAEIFNSYQDHLIQTLSRHPQQCLCHNDLNPDNIILQGSRVRLIDWEYAGLNSPYFDIATLVEMCQLNEMQAEKLSFAYWGKPIGTSERQVVKDFQIIVRFVNWLWFSLKAENQLANENLRRIHTLK